MTRKPKPAIKPTRSTRRVLLVLLTGAGRLSGYQLARTAQVGSVRTYAVLDRLETEGWAAGKFEDGPAPRRRFYHLTPRGRYYGLQMLGLEEGENDGS